jgi:hypothetical protein
LTSAQDLEFDFFHKDNKSIKVLAQHMYPWKASEVMGITGFFGFGLLLVIAVQPLILGATLMALSPYMLYLNNSRKRKSAIIFADTPAGLRIYKDNIAQPNPSQFHLNDVLEIGTTKDMDGNCFMVLRKADTGNNSDSGTIGFKIPSRIYESTGGKAYLWSVAELNSDIHISHEASKILHS